MVFSLPEWNPNQLLTHYLEVHIYIGFQTLKVKCTQYGICSQVAFKNARAIFFLKLGGSGYFFRSGEIFPEKDAPARITPPIDGRGVLNVTHHASSCFHIRHCFLCLTLLYYRLKYEIRLELVLVEPLRQGTGDVR